MRRTNSLVTPSPLGKRFVDRFTLRILRHEDGWSCCWRECSYNNPITVSCSVSLWSRLWKVVDFLVFCLRLYEPGFPTAAFVRSRLRCAFCYQTILVSWHLRCPFERVNWTISTLQFVFASTCAREGVQFSWGEKPDLCKIVTVFKISCSGNVYKVSFVFVFPFVLIALVLRSHTSTISKGNLEPRVRLPRHHFSFSDQFSTNCPLIFFVNSLYV